MTPSKIEWTDRSDWNPIRGCTRVSEGCGSDRGGGCYAEAIAARFSDPGLAFHGFAERTAKGPRWTGKVKLIEDRVTLPLRWRAPEPGRNKVFVNSTSDIFHEALSDSDIDRIFAVMALAPRWTFQVLTKRSARMREYLTTIHNTPSRRTRVYALGARMMAADDPRRFQSPPRFPLPNVWLGVSVEDQARADERIPDLLATPAAVRFISAEPLLGPVDLESIPWPEHWPRCDCMQGDPHYDALNATVYCPGCCEGPEAMDAASLDWVIVGGESGPRARDNDFTANARSLLGQCRKAGIPFFGKQNYRKRPLPEDLMVREFPA